MMPPRFFLALLVVGAFFSPAPQGRCDAGAGGQAASPLVWPAGLPVYDHIVVVVEENKNYDWIVDNPAAPYINQILRANGANFTRMYAEEHWSQGNYFWLFSGDNQGVGFNDRVPSAQGRPDYPFATPNLGAGLRRHGLTFRGYAEGLPAVGFRGHYSPDRLYARKHVPWISFASLDNGYDPATSVNLRWEDFPADPSLFHSLPTVAFVIPNLEHDMHDGPGSTSIPAGDRWLREHLDAYYQWARTHNSLLILTFDESDNKGGVLGLTDPRACAAGQEPDRCGAMENRIVTIFAGAHIKAGDYPEGRGITHVNILRTIEAMYGLPRAGAQQLHAVAAGISDTFLISDIFEIRHDPRP